MNMMCGHTLHCCLFYILVHTQQRMDKNITAMQFLYTFSLEKYIFSPPFRLDRFPAGCVKKHTDVPIFCTTTMEFFCILRKTSYDLFASYSLKSILCAVLTLRNGGCCERRWLDQGSIHFAVPCSYRFLLIIQDKRKESFHCIRIKLIHIPELFGTLTKSKCKLCLHCETIIASMWFSTYYLTLLTRSLSNLPRPSLNYIPVKICCQSGKCRNQRLPCSQCR